MPQNKPEERSDLLRCRAVVDTTTYNEDDATVDVIFATDTPVLTRDSNWELFYEILSTDPKHMRKERLDAGLSVLDNHNRYDSVQKVVLGRSTEYKISPGQCSATLKMSKRKELESFRGDIRDGIQKNISAGYKVYQYQDISQRDDKTPTWMATDWEPIEITFTPVQADYKSSVRSREATDENIEIIKNRNMPEPVTPVIPAVVEAAKPVETTRQDSPVDADKIRSEAVIAERKRVSEITLAVRTAKLDDDFLTEVLDKDVDINGARAMIIERWAKGQSPVSIAPAGKGGAVTSDVDEKAERRRGLEEALELRIGTHDKPSEVKSEYARSNVSSTLLDHARFMCESQEKGSTSGLNREEIFKRAMASTDYPISLANVLNKSLKKPFQMADPVWRKFATQVTATDFKPIAAVRVDGSFQPVELTEKGEYKEASFLETGDSFGLKSWGRKISLTRKMLINDDLSAFTQYAPQFANGIINQQAALVYALIAGTGRVLADSVALFNAASHNNYVSAGSALSLASLTAAKLAMRRQKGLAGEPISITPKYLVVPPELEILAMQLIHSSIVPTTTSSTNPFYGAFDVLVDPFLTDPKAWYIISDPASIDVIKYATLSGQEGIFTEQRYNFDNDNLEIKVRTDFNATIEEFRGIYKNVGA